MKKPFDLVSCERYQCLYISDYEHEVIHKVKVENSSCSKWSVNSTPHGLSVTRSSNVLITLSVHRVKEYTTDGSLIRQISLDVSIDCPQHSIELSTGQFVVSQTGKEQYRVCIVNTAGLIIHSYGGQEGKPDGPLGSPVHLAVDAGNNVVVADCYNKRLVLLSSQLTHISTLSSLSDDRKLGISNRLYLHSQTSRLFVADFEKIYILT